MKMTFHKETKVIFELSVVKCIKNNVAIIKIAKSKSTGSPTPQQPKLCNLCYFFCIFSYGI